MFSLNLNNLKDLAILIGIASPVIYTAFYIRLRKDFVTVETLKAAYMTEKDIRVEFSTEKHVNEAVARIERAVSELRGYIMGSKNGPI